MLSKIRLDYPELNIIELISFNENEYGFYDVKVNINQKLTLGYDVNFTIILAYPFLSYVNLSDVDKLRFKNRVYNQ